MDKDNTNLIKSDLADELRIEGIKYLGYGIIPKFVMLDKDLSAEAKAIYAYFCSYAGSGNTAFPGRDKILNDLHMSKDSYYKHYKMLLDEGFIKATQVSTGGKGQGFNKNVYTLVSKPKKFLKGSKDNKENIAYAVIKASGLEADGYGFIPKAVMVDPSISVKAKALYAYYCSFAGTEGSACPKKDNILYHLQLSHNTYSKYQKELIDRNFIRITQRQIDGRLSVNDVYIIDNPDKENAQKGRAFEIVCPKKQSTKIKDTQIEDSQIQYTQNKDTNKNNQKINNLKNNQSNNQQQSASLEDDGWKDDLILKIFSEKVIPQDILKDESKLEFAVHYLCEYERLSNPKEYEDLEDNEFKYDSYILFVDALISLLSGYSKQIEGITVTSEKVRVRLSRYIEEYGVLEVCIHRLIESAQFAYKDACRKTVPKYPLKFMQRIIWNVLSEGEIKTAAEIIHDFT